jgi:cytochrome c oxidase cbb3-type subunit I/II
MQLEKIHYDNKIVKAFIIATVIFGIVGMTVGLLAAIQLFYPIFNFSDSAVGQYISFGRIRPLHTNAIIFAFVGNAMFAGVYYSMQRLLKARLFSDALSWFHFWGWQLIILAAAITLPLGFTTSKEYAELEWPIDIAIAVVWVAFGINMIGTIIKRREQHMYVAVWFYIATFVTVAVLHIVNSFEIPVTFFKSYSWYAGVQDALGAMVVRPQCGGILSYHTIPWHHVLLSCPRQLIGRCIHTDLSIIHFWSLIFIYIWAGPHHLLYTALPDWAQSLGVVFSIMLIAPSWGGMLNGLFTLRGAWDRVREDAVLKFMVVAVTAYGMATLEGPLLSLKNVNAIAHYTDWIVAHVHVGGLGWNGFLIFGMLYWLVPRMWNTKLYSSKLANLHFWIGTLGIVFYALPMYVSGVVQSLMWKEFAADGFLRYQNFLETTTQILPMYALRAVGGGLYLTGVIIMTYNLVKTAAAGSFTANEEAEVSPLVKVKHAAGGYWHHILEAKPILFTVLALVAILIGGIIELVPTFLIKSNVPTIVSVKPYTPLELHGRDIYIREGCVNCHSQMIRPFRSEVQRYDPKGGEYSKAGEFIYDHPFLWGSKRTGPDLHRVGGKYADSWHFRHMLTPGDVSTGSIMPAYPWLYEQQIDKNLTAGKISALRTIGVPYADGYEEIANAELDAQAKRIADNLSLEGLETTPDAEIVALIAYLQRLGTDIKLNETAQNQ